ncbi:MAG: hypothetical protein KKE17_01795 [Proteobacteria bacterium]|nr:hypothetical protein [Pseudomonadota bacterium]MBU1708715.1 hypothetical protein [Pseudomonadota bacterium]
MKKLSIILTLCLFTLISGCKLKFEDVSDHPGYKPLLNTRFSLTNEMFISGVNLSPGYGEEINIYTISPTQPTWSGPELITRDTLTSGTILKVLGFRRSINSVLFEGKKIEAVVAVEPYEIDVNVPVVIELKYLTSTKYIKKVD